MIKADNLKVTGIIEAIMGMRAPMESYSKMDSIVDDNGVVRIGANDLDLMTRLGKAGTEHRKFLRAINVSLCIEAPLFWWKEFDTYKIGTISNSESTMHKLHTKELLEDGKISRNIFSMESLEEEDLDIANMYIEMIDYMIAKFNETKDRKYWRKAIELLPSSFMQKRYIYTNMETILNICRQRCGHRLYEWSHLINFLITENVFIGYLVDNLL